ncbi:hypothetical protein [Micromonospora sp. WMMD980]|uniref:hypothetical protein n=1 Tax=Micromonospora sp. WMMD980 TaxID=3016088 RepID=UPI002417D619|nr:hypothetical protein [Micromonospora sp. WMMD980]MDG4801829.1 hypothetical protein [Micromonospora sp. WMMD980]
MAILHAPSARPAPDAGARRNDLPRYLHSLVVGMAWLIAGGACFTLDHALPGEWDNNALVALSGLAIAFGGWVFWRHGGPRITAVAVYNLAFAVFIGFGGLYHGLKNVTTDPGIPLLTTVAVCFFSHVLTWMLFWGTGAPAAPRSDAARADAGTAGWAVTFGLVLLAIAVVASLAAPQSVFTVRPVGFVGVVLVATGLLRGPMGRWTVLCGSVCAVTFTIYFFYLFDGFGRIVIGTLALALLVILAHGDRRPLSKTLVIVGAAPVLLFLAALRAGGAESTVDSDGFGSAVSPMSAFAQLWQMNAGGTLPHSSGGTFFASLVALVPRGLWPEKPAGFGYELVSYLAPQLAGTGHSVAALWQGEWLFNFGVAGMVVMIPVTGLAVRGIDWFLARASARPLTTPRALGCYVAAVLAAVGLFDLVWVGGFTYMTRTGPRLLVLALLVVTTAWLTRRPMPLEAADRRFGPDAFDRRVAVERMRK